LGFVENPIIPWIVTKSNCNRICSALRADLPLLGANPQIDSVKAHSQASEKHQRSQISAHPWTELDRKGESAMPSREIIDHSAQKHVRQPAVHFPAALPASSGGKSHFGNFLSAVGAAIQPHRYRLPAIGTRPRGHCLPLNHTAHTLPHPPSLLA
jgi:hypothetical protein